MVRASTCDAPMAFSCPTQRLEGRWAGQSLARPVTVPSCMPLVSYVLCASERCTVTPRSVGADGIFLPWIGLLADAQSATRGPPPYCSP